MFINAFYLLESNKTKNSLLQEKESLSKVNLNKDEVTLISDDTKTSVRVNDKNYEYFKVEFFIY